MKLHVLMELFLVFRPKPNSLPYDSRLPLAIPKTLELFHYSILDSISLFILCLLVLMIQWDRIIFMGPSCIRMIQT